MISNILGAFHELLKEYGTNHKRTSPNLPQTDSLTEQYRGTIIKSLNQLVQDKPEEWDCHLPKGLLGYRATLYSFTKMSPFFLVYARHPLLPVYMYKMKDLAIEEMTTITHKTETSLPARKLIFPNKKRYEDNDEDVLKDIIQRGNNRTENVIPGVVTKIDKAPHKQ